MHEKGKILSNCAHTSHETTKHQPFKKGEGLLCLNDDSPKEKPEISKFRFRRGDNYILCDLGGGTADICYHQILNLGEVREISLPSGGPWGSMFIDEAFIQFLKNILPKGWMSEYEKSYPSDFLTLRQRFEYAKTKFYDESTRARLKRDALKKEKIYNPVAVPKSFTAFLTKKLNSKNSGKIRKKTLKKFLKSLKFSGKKG